MIRNVRVLVGVIAACDGGCRSDDFLAPVPDLALGCAAASWVEDVSDCVPLATDYQPRVNASQDDEWPACISDDGEYHPVDPNRQPVLPRVVAIEEIGRLLWNGPVPPGSPEFVEARTIYGRSDGLSRFLQAAKDIHALKKPPPGVQFSCGELGSAAEYADLCVGAKLLQVVNDAFQRGVAGDQPQVQAARIQAALLWYLQASVMNDANAALYQTSRYGDDAWDNYCGGRELDQPLALARFVRSVGPETHGRVWDGLLAVRCRTDLNRLGLSYPALQQRALEQLDRAVIRGLALVLRRRLGLLGCADSSDERDAHLAFVRLLGGFLDRAARAVDPDRANMLAGALATGAPGAAEIDAAQAAIDTLFPCP